MQVQHSIQLNSCMVGEGLSEEFMDILGFGISSYLNEYINISEYKMPRPVKVSHTSTNTNISKTTEPGNQEMKICFHGPDQNQLTNGLKT